MKKTIEVNLSKAKKEAWVNVDIRIHQEYLPKVTSTIINHCAASLLTGMVLISLWAIRPDQFGLALNIILTLIIAIAYIVITRGLIEFVSKTTHRVADMAIFEQNSVILHSEEVQEDKENATETTSN